MSLLERHLERAYAPDSPVWEDPEALAAADRWTLALWGQLKGTSPGRPARRYFAGGPELTGDERDPDPFWLAPGYRETRVNPALLASACRWGMSSLVADLLTRMRWLVSGRLAGMLARFAMDEERRQQVAQRTRAAAPSRIAGPLPGLVSACPHTGPPARGRCRELSAEGRSGP